MILLIRSPYLTTTSKPTFKEYYLRWKTIDRTFQRQPRGLTQFSFSNTCRLFIGHKNNELAAMIQKSILLGLAVFFLDMLFTNCNNASPEEITVLQIHLEDSLSIQAGISAAIAGSCTLASNALGVPYIAFEDSAYGDGITVMKTSFDQRLVINR
jgi:hypothetical protein